MGKTVWVSKTQTCVSELKSYGEIFFWVGLSL